MASRRPMPGPGCCQWNTVAWFSGQIGSAAWMLTGAVMLAREAREVAAVWVACFFAVNAVGFHLWSRRRRLRPFPAMQVGFLACGATGLIALVALHLLRPGLLVTRPPGVALGDPWMILALPFVMLALMVGTSLVEWSARKERARSKDRA